MAEGIQTAILDKQLTNAPEDTEARRLALNIHHSYIVQAPAGSGKTTLLTQRVLALLAQGVSTPEECLCITFTQKAAAEMRARVLCALESAAMQQSAILDPTTHALAQQVLERDKILNWDILNNPNRLRIQTIDSLCAELAQRMPLHSGLSGGMKIADNPEVFYEEAAVHILEALESNEPWSDSVSLILEYLDNDWEAAVHLLSDMLSHRDQWLLSLGPTFFNKPDRSELEKSLQISIQQTLQSTLDVVPKECSDEILSLARFAAANIDQKIQSDGEMKDSQILNCLNVQEWPEDSLETLPVWLGLAELLLTDNHQLRKIVTDSQGFPSQQSTKDKADKALFKEMKARMQNCLTLLQDCPKFCLALQTIRECPPPNYTDLQWKIIQALLTLLPMLVAELLVAFQRQGQVDFIEVALAAHQALGDKDTPTDIALQLGYKTKHILVDEFQDTSLSQFLLLEKLTLTWSEYEGNTLFLVGDPMQSIYRFRRADVGLFIQAKTMGINEFDLTALQLSANFRSDPSVIDWVNENFARLFPKNDDILTGAIRYTAFHSAKNNPNLNFELSEVKIHSVTQETEANIILECLESLRKKDNPGTMALLVRSRSHLKTILPVLEAHKIPYQGIELERLNVRPAIQDLLVLSRALIHLGDRIAWLALLRSPYCGLALNDIELIANFHDSLPIFWSLKHYETIAGISVTAKELIAIFLPVIEQAIFERERLTSESWIRNVAGQLCQTKGIMFDYMSKPECETFFKILREIPKTEDIFTLGVLEQKINEHYATPRLTDPHALQVMTIHKAKGLEFDTVLLAGLGRKERVDPPRLLLWEERRQDNGQPYLLLAPIRSSDIKKDPIYEYLRKQEQRRAEYERLRLLYVASTRAKKRLYGFAHDDSLFLE